MIAQIKNLPSIDATCLLWETQTQERIDYLELFYIYQYPQIIEGKKYRYVAVHKSWRIEEDRNETITTLAGTNLQELKKAIRTRYQIKIIGEGDYLTYKFIIYTDYDIWEKESGKVFRCHIEGVPAIGGFDSLPRQHLHCLGKIREHIMYLSGVTDCLG